MSELGYENFAVTSLLSFVYSVRAHWRIDGKRVELMERWYPKRPAVEKHLSSEAFYHQNKYLQLYGAQALALSEAGQVGFSAEEKAYPVG